MSVIRQPVCVHRNVQLTAPTSLSNDDAVPSCDRSQTSPRKMAAKKRNAKSQSADLTVEVGATTPSPLSLPPSNGHDYLQSYCQVIPCLSIALFDGPFNPSILLPPISSFSVAPFTHLIRVQYSTPLLDPGLAWSEYYLDTGTLVLNLIVPTPQQQPREDQGQTFLTDYQLIFSRDFLSFALPYCCPNKQPSWDDQFPSPNTTHVLVTAPPGPLGCMRSSNVVYVMSIIACYLTFSGGDRTATVVESVDNGVDVFGMRLPDVWKGSIKRDRIEAIQRVANILWVKWAGNFWFPCSGRSFKNKDFHSFCLLFVIVPAYFMVLVVNIIVVTISYIWYATNR